MSVKYSISAMKNPLRPQIDAKYYAKAQVREVIDIDRIAGEIAQATSLSEGDVLNVVRNVPRYVTSHMADGDLVDLGQLGRFQFQLSSEGTNTREEFTHHNIKRARIQFRPGRLMKQVLNTLQFEQVVSVKEKAEAKRQSKGRQIAENP